MMHTSVHSSIHPFIHPSIIHSSVHHASLHLSILPSDALLRALPFTVPGASLYLLVPLSVSIQPHSIPHSHQVIHQLWIETWHCRVESCEIDRWKEQRARWTRMRANNTNNNTRQRQDRHKCASKIHTSTYTTAVRAYCHSCTWLDLPVSVQP